MTDTSNRVDDAAVWATAHWWNSPRPLVPFLKRKFRLSDAEAMDAFRAASDEIVRNVNEHPHRN